MTARNQWQDGAGAGALAESRSSIPGTPTTVRTEVTNTTSSHTMVTTSDFPATLSSAFPIPPNAATILLHCIETQQRLRANATRREEQHIREDEAKSRRLAMLRQQQQRREKQNLMDSEALQRTNTMLEELVAAVRDREVSLRPDGHQAFVFPNEDVYEGNWKSCRMHGKGCMRRVEVCDLYEGQWFLGQRCGPGTLRSANFSTFYSGAWLDNKRHGRGELVEPEGVYSGEFIDNRISGFGEYVYKDGHVYRGDWRDGMYHGSGTYLYPSGSKYEGNWRMGYESGPGTRVFPNGDTYTGEWHEGLPHGLGVYTSAEFTTASHHTAGHQRDNSKAAEASSSSSPPQPQRAHFNRLQSHSCRGGPGPVSRQRAFRFEGRWVYGTIQGNGTCVFTDGAVYSGLWWNGMPHGQGIAQFRRQPIFGAHVEADGVAQQHVLGAVSYCYSGEFVRGKRHGFGMYTGPLSQYVGEWHSDAKEGHGALKVSGSGTYDGGWRADAPDGVGTYIADNEPLDHPFFAPETKERPPSQPPKSGKGGSSKAAAKASRPHHTKGSVVVHDGERDDMDEAERDSVSDTDGTAGPDDGSRPQSRKVAEAKPKRRPMFVVECVDGVCVRLTAKEDPAPEPPVAETNLNLRLQIDAAP